MKTNHGAIIPAAPVEEGREGEAGKKSEVVWTQAHACPVCNGAGSVSRPPHVPGDVMHWTTAGVDMYQCRACAGTGIVWNRSEAPAAASDGETIERDNDPAFNENTTVCECRHTFRAHCGRAFNYRCALDGCPCTAFRLATSRAPHEGPTSGLREDRCYVLPDGTCVSPFDCVHGPGVDLQKVYEELHALRTAAASPHAPTSDGALREVVRRLVTAGDSVAFRANRSDQITNAAVECWNHETTIALNALDRAASRPVVENTGETTEARPELPGAVEVQLSDWSQAKTCAGGRSDDALISLYAGKLFLGHITLGWFRKNTTFDLYERAILENRAEDRVVEKANG